jgi:hypothetical protein
VPTVATVTQSKQPQSPRVAGYERRLKFLTLSFYDALRAADAKAIETLALQMVSVSERLGAARHALRLERLIMGVGYEDELLPPDDAILDVVVAQPEPSHADQEVARQAVEAPA